MCLDAGPRHVFPLESLWFLLWCRRNVAAEVADKLSDSVSNSVGFRGLWRRVFITSQVRKSLVGKTTGRFTSMASTVKQALKDRNSGNCGACMVRAVLLFVVCLLFSYCSAGVHGDTLDAKEVDWCGPVPSMPSLIVWVDQTLLGSLGLAQLRAALAAKNAGRVPLAQSFEATESPSVRNMAFWCQVYTIVFLGVNGVGKSTNLAKAVLRKGTWKVECVEPFFF